MARIKYIPDQKIKEITDIIVSSIPEYFSHIDTARVFVYRSYNTRSGAIARIHGFPRIWQLALGSGPAYIIEIISENFDCLQCHDKIRTIIHELLHIPKTFSGGLRPHGRYVNSRIINRAFRILSSRLVIEDLCNRLEH